MTDGSVLIAGADGFLGRSFGHQLLTYNPQREVFAVVRSQTALPEKITQIVVEDWSLAGLAHAVDGRQLETIFHLAAHDVPSDQTDTSKMLAANTVMPNTMVLLARMCGAALVGVGCSSEYALPMHGRTIDENAPLQATTLRGASKAAGWLTASASAVAYDVPYAHLRLFDVFGPGESADSLLPSLAAALSEGRRMPLCDGAQIRDFIHVDDVCKALVSASLVVRKLGRPQAFNICTGWAHSMRSFVETACEVLGGERYLLGFGDLDRRHGEPPVLIGDPAKAESVLGFRARGNLKAGLARTLGRSLQAA